MSSDPPADAEAFNRACFELSRASEGLPFTEPGARTAVKALLRAAGRVVIDAASPGAGPAGWSGSQEMLLAWLDELVEPLGYRVTPDSGSGRPPLERPGAGW